MSWMLSEKIKKLPASPTLALAAKAGQLKTQGHDVISLTVGEPDWPTVGMAKEAGKKAIDENKTTYTPASGILELKEAISKLISNQLKLSVNSKEVIVGPGAKFVIYSALNALLDPGDEVILPAPYWVSYPAMISLAGGTTKVVVCDETSGFKLTAEKLQKAIGPKTKALILNSPNNPTGAEYSGKELLALGSVISEHPGVVVLSDDIYNQLSFGEEALSPHLLQQMPELRDRCVCINGMSKAYAMTGWRMGWGVGPELLIKAMTNFQSQTVGPSCSISQWASVAAINDSSRKVQDHLKTLKQRKQIFIEKLSAVDGLKVFHPQGAFYLWIDVRKWLNKIHKGEKLKDSRQVANCLLAREKLVVVPGQEFGLDAYLRLSFAVSPKNLEQGAARMARFRSQLS